MQQDVFVLRNTADHGTTYEPTDGGDIRRSKMAGEPGCEGVERDRTGSEQLWAGFR